MSDPIRSIRDIRAMLAELQVDDSTFGCSYKAGKDVAERLGYADTSDAIGRHCKGSVIRLPLQTAGGVQAFVSELDRTDAQNRASASSIKGGPDVLRDIRNMLEQLGLAASSFAGSIRKSAAILEFAELVLSSRANQG